jgi:putative transposase
MGKARASDSALYFVGWTSAHQRYREWRKWWAEAHPASYNRTIMSNYRRADATGATYFFTVTLANRQSDLLVKEVACLKYAFTLTAATAPFETVAMCVLPDHLHCIWLLPEGDNAYPQRWAAIKARFSRGLDAAETRSDSKITKREKGIWQRRYWEHQIRDELDLQRHMDYIHMNPVKHGLVMQVRDWPHSSFHRYVKEGKLPADWGGVDNGFTVPE